MINVFTPDHARLRVQQTEALELSSLCRFPWQVDARQHDSAIVQWFVRRYKSRETFARAPTLYYYASQAPAARAREIDSVIHVWLDGVSDLVWRCRQGEKETLVMDLIVDLFAGTLPALDKTPRFVVDVMMHLLTLPMGTKQMARAELVKVDWGAWLGWMRQAYHSSKPLYSLADSALSSAIFFVPHERSLVLATLGVVGTERIWREFLDWYMAAVSSLSVKTADVPDPTTLFEWFVCALIGGGDAFVDSPGLARGWFRYLGPSLCTLTDTGKKQLARIQDWLTRTLEPFPDDWSAARGQCEVQLRAMDALFENRGGLPAPRQEFSVDTRLAVAAEMEPAAADAYLRLASAPWTAHRLDVARRARETTKGSCASTVLLFFDSSVLEFQLRLVLHDNCRDDAAVVSLYVREDLARRPYHDVCTLVELSTDDADNWCLANHLHDAESGMHAISSALVLYGATAGSRVTEWVPALWSALTGIGWPCDVERAHSAMARSLAQDGHPLAMADLAQLCVYDCRDPSTEAALYEASRLYLTNAQANGVGYRTTLVEAHRQCLERKHTAIAKDIERLLQESQVQKAPKHVSESGKSKENSAKQDTTNKKSHDKKTPKPVVKQESESGQSKENSAKQDTTNKKSCDKKTPKPVVKQESKSGKSKEDTTNKGSLDKKTPKLALVVVHSSSSKRKSPPSVEDDSDWQYVRKRLRIPPSMIPLPASTLHTLFVHVKTLLQKGEIMVARLVFASLRCDVRLPEMHFGIDTDTTSVPSPSELVHHGRYALSCPAALAAFVAAIPRVLRPAPKWEPLSLTDCHRSWNDATQNRLYMLKHPAFGLRSIRVPAIDPTRVPETKIPALDWFLSRQGREWIRRSASVAWAIGRPAPPFGRPIETLVRRCSIPDPDDMVDAAATAGAPAVKPATAGVPTEPDFDDSEMQLEKGLSQMPLAALLNALDSAVSKPAPPPPVQPWPPLHRGRSESQEAKQQQPDANSELDAIRAAVVTLLDSTPTLRRAAQTVARRNALPEGSLVPETPEA